MSPVLVLIGCAIKAGVQRIDHIFLICDSCLELLDLFLSIQPHLEDAVVFIAIISTAVFIHGHDLRFQVVSCCLSRLIEYGLYVSFIGPQVSRIRFRSVEKIWYPQASRLTSLISRFNPSQEALEQRYFQVF